MTPTSDRLEFETTDDGLYWHEGDVRFELALPPQTDALLFAALGLVTGCPDSDGARRAESVLRQRDETAVQLAAAILLRATNGRIHSYDSGSS